jgi:hypothetical protein
MITSEQAIEAAEHIRKAAEILKPNVKYTVIELLAAFNRGIETIGNGPWVPHFQPDRR